MRANTIERHKKCITNGITCISKIVLAIWDLQVMKTCIMENPSEALPSHPLRM